MLDELIDDLFGRTLLPGNATALELAFDEALARRWEALPRGETIPDALSWERCAVPLLPFLAWEWSVDEWDPAWPEAQHRAAIASSWELHGAKGTVTGIERAVGQLGYGATIQEWFSYGGQPFRFRLAVDSPARPAWSAADYAQLYRVAIRAKNVRSYLETLQLHVTGPEVPIYVGAVVRSRIRIRPSTEPVANIGAQFPVFVGAVMRTRIRSKPVVT